MKVRFGHRDIEYPSADLAVLEDSNDCLADPAALRARLADQGVLYLRNVIDRDVVLRARETILEHLAAHECLVPDTPLLEGVMPAGGHTVPMMGRKHITHHPHTLAALESPALFELFENLFGEPALTFNYKWLRAVGNEEYTGAHYDIVYMGRGSTRLHTAWIPFGDIEIENGALAVIPQSHTLPGYQKVRDTYGRLDVDRDHTIGWFSRDPMELTESFGGRWHTAPYRAGDIVLFGMHLMHASTTNVTPNYRLSCDVRFQPTADPVDDRWIGDEPPGHSALGKNIEMKPIATARAEWGV